MTTTTTDTTIVDAVIEGLAETLDRPMEGVTAQTSLFHEIGLDSTGVLDLLMVLEERLGIELDVESLEMKDFTTVGTLAAYLAHERDA
ncbi:acyl carrier protein [Luteipulveratus sp. YIM 133132]|uniref:Acyl carrier protein n=1 Tax=Luteipulveratus flavus TaxID=3031728 RepID=A0ABT6C6M2_9MICO|nr:MULTISPECIES: acyl carrier protein [unclassified Luteipulveratus]MDE9365078.1 acyl carrier protein [Luteipulveratus sp. YIM 133132]MDF8264586.1 acyl carrier protein [Luteipulveratus sp. YIM 133296]